MISILNVVKKFDSQIILDNINLNIYDNEKVLFIGQNGAGKSSLMKTILGEYIPDSGNILINGFSPFKSRKKAISSISFVPQTPPPLKFNLAEIIYYATKSSNINSDRVNFFLDKLDFDLSYNLKKPFYKLSGGMKQKFLIAVAFGRDTDVVIFDEPTANLDPNAREKFYRLLNEFFSEKNLIFISHRLTEVENIINRVIEMDLGKIVNDRKYF